MSEPVEVGVVGPDDPDAAAIRHEVFVLGQGIDPSLERDGRDGGAAHVLARRAGRAVGTGRLTVERDRRDRPVGRLGRMAVRAGERGRGVGAALLRALEDEATERNLAAVRMHAQAGVVDFYRRAGYRVTSDPFLEAGIEHRGMQKSLPVVRPVADTDSAALIGLIAACFADYPGCVLDVDDEEPWLRAPATAYAGEGGRMWVATLGDGWDDAVVACVGVKPGGTLKNLYVAAAARRHGLGSRLAGLVEAHVLNEGFRAAGEPAVRLWTDTRFTDAHRLYERRGYRRTGRTRDLSDRSHTTEYEYVLDLLPVDHVVP